MGQGSLGLILVLFCLTCAYFVYRQGVLLVEEAALAKSQIVMATVEATQNYVREILRPRVTDSVNQFFDILFQSNQEPLPVPPK